MIKVIKVDDACDVARRLLRDFEYGYSYDDLTVEVESFMDEFSFEVDKE